VGILTLSKKNSIIDRKQCLIMETLKAGLFVAHPREMQKPALFISCPDKSQQAVTGGGGACRRYPGVCEGKIRTD
jgi:hypothetical protein